MALRLSLKEARQCGWFKTKPSVHPESRQLTLTYPMIDGSPLDAKERRHVLRTEQSVRKRYLVIGHGHLLNEIGSSKVVPPLSRMRRAGRPRFDTGTRGRR